MASAGLIQNLKAQISSPVGFAVPKLKPTVGWGLPGLDQLTGGIPRGAMMEIHGGTSSGRSSLAARLLAVLTREGEICAYLDAANGFDPPSAAAAGCVLSRVLWIKCGGRLDHTLQAGDQLLNAGGFGLIVMDLLGLTPRMLNKIPASYWFRFRRVLEGSNTTLVLLSSRSLMQSCSALTLELQRNEAQWVGPSKFAVLSGYGVRTGMTRPGPGSWANLPVQHGDRKTERVEGCRGERVQETIMAPAFPLHPYPLSPLQLLSPTPGP